MLEVTDLTLAFGHQQVLNGVNFKLDSGDIACILGPSGCGKTSLMRSIAGFNQIDAGQIEIAGNMVATSTSCLPVATRKVGVVFQDFALFPHFTVMQNVAYGLDHLLPDQRNSTAQTFIELVGLSEHSDKLPHQLSGGQQQRVAIARALAPKPDLLLLDEPFSSLDPELRSSIAQEVRQIIKQNGTTALLITHDQNEAFTMADKIGVLHEGICVQWSDAHTLYHQPNNEFVARFIGEGTFIRGHVELDNEAESVNSQLGKFLLPSKQSFGTHQTVKLLVRPDDIIHDDNSPFKAIVVSREFRGANILYTLKLENHAEQVMCLAPSHHDHMPNESFGIRLDLSHVICFEHV